MYPFRVILIGPTEGQDGLITALAEQGAAIEGRFLDLHALRTKWKPESREPRVFALRLAGDEDIDVLHELSETFPGFPILTLVEPSCDNDTLYRISRSGAAQLVRTTDDEEKLRAAFDTLLRQYGRTRRVGRVIAVTAVPGSADSAPFSVNLAFEIAASGVTCVLAEPGARLGRLRSYIESPVGARTDVPAAPNPQTLQAVEQSLVRVNDHLRILPGQQDAISDKPPESAQMIHLVELMRQVSDTVVLDVQPTFDDAYYDLVCRAEHTLILAEQTVPSIHALRAVQGAISARRPAGVRHVVLPHYDSSRSGFAAEHIRTILHEEQIWTVTEDRNAWREVVDKGCAMRVSTPRSPALLDLERLVIQLLGPKVKS